jgi:hypothetical protein
MRSRPPVHVGAAGSPDIRSARSWRADRCEVPASRRRLAPAALLGHEPLVRVYAEPSTKAMVEELLAEGRTLVTGVR